ncbi:MAG TPA: universal stress protein [Bacteroidales bacterium]
MKRFLIPLDFSDNSMPVCNYAIQLAGNEKIELHLFHIFPDQIMVPDSSFPVGIDSDTFMNTEYISGLRSVAEKKMKEFRKELQTEIDKKSLENIKLKSMISGGDPEWEITAICEEIKPFMIIMGTRGEGKKGFLEGSMAEKIMAKATIPVIAVPESHQKFHLKNVLYATNFSQVDALKIEKLFSILSNFKVAVHVVHFQLSGKTVHDADKMNGLKTLFKSEFRERNVHFHLITSESKMDSLDEFTKKHAIDLITFISHKSNFFKSLFSNKITKKDFFKLELPMLAMHEEP